MARCLREEWEMRLVGSSLVSYWEVVMPVTTGVLEDGQKARQCGFYFLLHPLERISCGIRLSVICKKVVNVRRTRPEFSFPIQKAKPADLYGEIAHADSEHSVFGTFRRGQKA